MREPRLKAWWDDLRADPPIDQCDEIGEGMDGMGTAGPKS